MQNERFKQLAQKFLERTRDELQLLAECLPAAQAGQAEALRSLLHIAHRINGSGAMLGFKDVSVHAAQIESVLRRSESMPSAQDWQAINAHVEQLRASLLAADAQHAPDYD